MDDFMDLTNLGSTFPEMGNPPIPRDNLISLIEDQFSSELKVVVVQGAIGSGRTTLLAQFAKKHADKCFSFFVGTTLPTSHPRAFLMDMCEQLGKVLGRPTESLDRYDTEQLKVMYLDLIRQIGQFSRQTQNFYYFVIDGIEWIRPSPSEPSILDYLPGEPKWNLRVLLSSEVGRTFTFKSHQTPMIFFSPKDTESYLSGLHLSPEHIQTIHKKCQGMPGYLACLKRLLNSGASFAELNDSLPYELKELFRIEWNRTTDLDSGLEKLLALLAHSRELLSLELVAEILALDTPSRLAYEDKIRRVSFLRIDPKSRAVGFISDAYKQFVSDKLSHLRESSENLLIRYYESDQYSKSSLVLLPHYLASQGKYERLKEIVTSEYVARALSVTHDAVSLQKAIAMVADHAVQKGDLPSLFGYTLVSSILASLSTEPMATAEVEALLELGDYERAYAVAYESLLIEDKLQLAALIANRMQQAGISVPESIVIDLEQMATAIDVQNLGERSTEIAANLFDILPTVAISLVERAGVDGNSERSLDIARACLFITLDKESKDVVTSRIRDKTLRDFATANSPQVARMSADEILAHVPKISATSGKLLSLISWCNEHRGDGSAWMIVEFALETITGDPTYAPSLRTLRRLAQAVKPTRSHEVAKVIQRIDLLKSTTLQTPLEEAIWLELALARLEREFDEEQAKTRMLEAYYSIESHDDLYAQCYALLRVLLVSPLIDPHDSLEVTRGAEESLKVRFSSLLSSAAEHDEVAGRLLVSLARTKHDLAIELAQQLNTVDRRDTVLQKILVSYIKQKEADAELSVVEQIIRLISNTQMQQYARVQATHILCETDIFQKRPDTRAFLRHSADLEHPVNKAHSLAFAMNALEQVGDVGFVSAQYKALVNELERIDTKWGQVGLGFNLSSILGKKVPQFAKKLFEYSTSKRLESPLGEKLFALIYSQCLGLAIKLVPNALMHGTKDLSPITRIVSLIQKVPSFGSQCELLADLAIELKKCERVTEFRQLVHEYLIPCLDNCANAPARRTALDTCGPTLYEYEGELFFDRIKVLPASSKDDILHGIARYLLSGCQSDDPVDFKKLKTEVDATKAKRICEVIQRMSTDSQITAEMERLVEAIVTRDPYDPRRERCSNMIERDALEIANRLESIGKDKLPDPNNIRHNGYLILTRIYVTRLRDAAQSRSSNQQNWQELLSQADSIPNIADRVFVYINFAEQTSGIQSILAETALKRAEGIINDIRNPLDRAARLYGIANAWKQLGRQDAVKELLRDSVLALGAFPLTKQRDEIVGQVLELAHSVDPNFASNLAPTVENPMAEHRARLEWGAKSLQKSPQNIEHDKNNDLKSMQKMLGKAALDMTAELNAGAGILPHGMVPIKWLRQMASANFDDTFNVASWALQFILKQKRGRDEIARLFHVLVDILGLCTEIGNIRIGNQCRVPSMSDVALPPNLKIFKAGSKKEALGEVNEWILSNTSNYIKIYDAYFTFANLELLKSVSTDTRVYIVTSWKSQTGISPGERRVETLFKEAWRGISTSDPPWTQIVVIGIKSGDSPIHSRFIFTDGKGLSLGTSIGSLGAKDSELRSLDPEESRRLEVELVDPMLGPQLRTFKNEQLLVHTFIL